MDHPKPPTEAHFFRDPAEYPPPRGVKLILGTRYGTCVQGHWNDSDCLGWLPMPKYTTAMKSKMSSMAPSFAHLQIDNGNYN